MDKVSIRLRSDDKTNLGLRLNVRVFEIMIKGKYNDELQQIRSEQVQTSVRSSAGCINRAPQRCSTRSND